MQDDLIIYDALSLTSKIHSPEDLIDILGMQSLSWDRTLGGSGRGFTHRLYYDAISIHSGNHDGFIWLEMMGQGCRAFETYGNGDYDALFQLVRDNPDDMKITRLDVAFDDHSGILDIKKLADDTAAGEYVSKFKAWQVTIGSAGTCIYHGSNTSELLLRIYDKAAERGYDSKTHWVRVELQLRRDRAKAFLEQGGSIGGRFAGVLANYVRYVDEDSGDSNRRRWPLRSYWADLLAGSAPIALYQRPGVDYNIANLDNFVIHQAGAAIDTYIQIMGVDTLRDQIRQRNPWKSDKYKKLLSESGKIGEHDQT